MPGGPIFISSPPPPLDPIIGTADLGVVATAVLRPDELAALRPTEEEYEGYKLVEPSELAAGEVRAERGGEGGGEGTPRCGMLRSSLALRPPNSPIIRRRSVPTHPPPLPPSSPPLTP